MAERYLPGMCDRAGLLRRLRFTWLAGGTARPQTVTAQSSSSAAAAAPAAPTRRRDADARRTARPSEDQAQQESVTVGDYLVKSLTAHSLDLPPRAAKVCFLPTLSHLVCLAVRSCCRCWTQSLTLTVITSPPYLCSVPTLWSASSICYTDLA